MIRLVNFIRHIYNFTVYTFFNNMVEESKYCSDMMKKNFNKEHMMTNEDNEDFKNFTKCWTIIILIMTLK